MPVYKPKKSISPVKFCEFRNFTFSVFVFFFKQGLVIQTLEVSEYNSFALHDVDDIGFDGICRLYDITPPNRRKVSEQFELKLLTTKSKHWSR